MKRFSFRPQGVCSVNIDIEVTDDNKIESVAFLGGCPGNLAGISMLVRGMDVAHVIERLEGITCGGKPTSCPDQLARALREVIGER
jgi:uncharacterized protein (TIGR03905 family)